MADPKGVYGIAAGSDYFLAFRASKELYDALATDLGLTKLNSAAELSKAVIIPAAAVFARLAISYEAAGKSRVGNVWCNPEKFEECLKGITGTYRSYTIKKVYQPLDSNRH